MAERGEDNLELRKRLRAIYQPLIGLKFRAWYKERVTIECSGSERDVFKLYNMGDTSTAITRILQNITEDLSEGDRSKEIVWKGFTVGEYCKLWVVPLDRYDLVKEKVYELVINSIDFFDETCDGFEWIKDYKVGMNILVSLN